MTSRPRKLNEGWLEYKQDKWQARWVVLRGSMMYIFHSRDTSEEQQHCGTLPIGPSTKVFVNRKDQQTGYKFEVETDRHCIRFRSKKFTERERWRGLIEGLVHGCVPSDLDLLEEEISNMKKELSQYMAEKNGKPSNRVSVLSGDSGVGEDIRSINSNTTRLHSSNPSMSSGSRDTASGSSEASSLPGGGPTLIHRFYEKARDQTPPSWFFSNCSRELAEMVLQKGQDFGNTLMRESTSHMQSGSYVVSKAVWDSRKGRCTYEHYEVMQVAQGYQLNVENEHKPMLYLSEVMAYFVKTTGGSSMPMSTNDLRQLGVDRQADYDRILRPPGEPWVWPPPDYDYDDVAVPQQQHRSVEPSKRAQTVTPRSSEKKVGFVPKTMATRQKSQQPQMPELAGRVQAANQLEAFNKIIDQYDQQPSTTSQSPVHSVSGVETVKPFKTPSPSISTIPAPPPPPPPPQSAPPSLTSTKATTLVTATPVTSLSPVTNLSSATSTIPPAPVAPLPPPTPHKVSHQPPYVNEGADDRLLETLPVAPPPPRVPLVNGPSSHNSSSSRPSSMTSAAPTFITNLQKTPQSTGARPVSSIPIGLNSTGSAGSVPSWLKQNIRSQPVNLTGSPEKLPTWSKPVTSAVKIDTVANNVAESSGNSSVVEAGVDDKNPGGVNNLRSKFEKQLSLNVVPTVKAVQKKPGAVTGPLRHSQSALAMSRNQGELYDELPADYENDEVPQANTKRPPYYPSKPSASTNIRHSASCTTLQQPVSSRIAQRHTSIPSLTTYHDDGEVYDDTVTESNQDIHSMSGLNPEFKNKLEGLFGGSSTGTTPLSPKGPASRSHNSHYENVYEELPDNGLIVPDAVTYVNEMHNT